ncbi:MAG: four helix bundle protein [Pyrinomonadaceae bacterium]|nr:four helix bundle protein [Acidobacteriota bacterium]MBP7377116.1 four helix bundle protein [Pyrinomonadaceae bacterium]
MATFKRFEDILAWQKSRVIARDVYLICGSGEFGRDYDLRSQIRRSSISIIANIAEGQGRRTDKDFAHFLNISLGSVAETKSHLYLALDVGHISQSQFDDLFEKLDEVGKMVFGLSSHLRMPS